MASADYVLVPHQKPYKYDDNGLHVTRGSAWTGPGCHIGCGVLVYTDDDGRLVKVEGDPENPFNQGRLCCRCLALKEVEYNKNRIVTPMKRAFEDRGKDKWVPISWDEAYDTIEQRFNEFKREYGPWTVAFYQGTGRDIASWITRLAWSFGSPNYMFNMTGMSCYVPRVAGCHATTGSFWVGDFSQEFADRYNHPGWQCPEHIWIWGNNPIVSNSDGLYGHWIVDCMKLGAKLIVADPKVTWLAAHAEVYLPVRPGTDAALALGIIHCLIEEDLYDHEFVENWCYGFEQLAEAAEPYTLERTAEITWCSAEKIAKAARVFATGATGVIQWGVAVDMTKEALPAGQAISAVYQICGFVDKPGCMIPPAEILNYAGGFGSELITEEMDAHRIGLDKYALLRFGFLLGSTDEMMKTMETDMPYKMHAAWLQTTNLLTCTSPDFERTLKCFQKLDFIVDVDLFMTPTAMALADIFLPAATFVERNGIRVGDGCQRGETLNRCVTRPGDIKSDQEINLELGKRFNPEAWPWNTVEEMYTDIYQCTGMTFEEMQENAPAYIPYEYEKYAKGKMRPDGQPGFNTQTGRIELWSTFYNNAGLDQVPFFEEPTPGPTSTPDLYEKFPIILTTGARNWSLFHSEHRQAPHLRALHKWPWVQMSPEDAADAGITQGEWVWVENERGRCKRVAEITSIMRKGFASADHAWWLPEANGELEEGLFGVPELNVANLIPYNPGKSGFGGNYKSMLCRIYKCGPNEGGVVEQVLSRPEIWEQSMIRSEFETTETSGGKLVYK